MEHTPEQLAARLDLLEEETRNIKESSKLKDNPFERVEFQLALENGSTVSARTRKVAMACISAAHDNDEGAAVIWTEGATEDVRATAPVPADWVPGTDITLNMTMNKAGADNETAVISYFIAVLTDAETFSFNVNDDTSDNQTIPASNELHTYTNTIAASNIALGDQISWVVRRAGASGSDTLSEDLAMRFGPWLEYTAFF